jgi:GTP-binding protein
MPSGLNSEKITKAALFYQHLNYYRDTTPPNGQQLNYANSIFTKDVKTSYLFSAAKFRDVPESDVPEVAFLGRSNVGKSSLLNSLFNRPNHPLANTSSKPGRTRTMNAFGIGQASSGGVILKPKTGNQHAKVIGRGGLVVVDMPGYGQGSRQEWGLEIVKYLCRRKQ